MSRPRPPVGDERGFSLVVAILVLAASTLLLFGAIDAVLFNVQATRNNLDQKRALLAAEGGLASYEQQLNQNQDYWDTCPGANGATGVTTTVGQTPVSVPGSTDAGSTEYYTYAELPATGTTYTGCSTANPSASVVQASTAVAPNTFRLKVTGYSKPTGGSSPLSRTIVAQFKANSFLNYVYFSNYEDEDPLYATTSIGSPTKETDANCEVYYTSRNPANCQVIPFGSGDSINGPLHSNDYILCGSTSVTFGRTSADAIETPNTISNNGCPSTTTGTQENQSNGGWTTLPMPSNDAQLLEVADGGNTALGSGSTLANDCSNTAGCVFNGPTTIVLDGPTSSSNAINRMTVTNGGLTATMAYPTNNVVYVNSTSACNYAYTPYASEDQLYGNTTLDPSYAYTSNSADTDNEGCGDVVVQQSPYTGSANGPSSGSCSVTTVTVNSVAMCPYTQSLTIGAANDVIVASPLVTTSTSSPSSCYGESSGCPTGTALLGLVANNMVRIFHPLTGVRNTNEQETACPSSNNTNGTGSLTNPVIDAAMMSVEDSFIIDNFDCGNTNSSIATPLGNLTVNGSIVQNFRGRIGEGGSNGNFTGYIKNYWYDERLQTLEPPYFLNPTSDSWSVDRLTECNSTLSC